MNNLVNMLAPVRSTNNHFIEHLDRIQGYTEEEILKIEKYHNISVHGQLKELLLVMGKSSGGLLFGDDFYIYRDIPRNGLERQIALMNEVDPTFRFLEICGVDDLVEKQFFEICGENEHMNLFFMFTKDITDDVYEWDENDETVKNLEHFLSI